MTKRKFEIVTGFEETAKLPKRGTAASAGYDFVAAEGVVIKPGETKFVSTGIKAKFPSDEALLMYNRSSMPTKRGLFMALGTGVVDSDYYNNADNEGHIKGVFTNIGDELAVIMPGERIMQGVFQKFGITDDDGAVGLREGGFGSTGEVHEDEV